MATLVSIVVPVFNEAGSLEALYKEIADALGPLGAFEVVFVDDGSTDGSTAVMERLSAAHDATSARRRPSLTGSPKRAAT
jgi:dolichol-phosphate mannosyltransferase